MRQFSDDPSTDARIRSRLKREEAYLVERAQQLEADLFRVLLAESRGADVRNKERQLRNILAIAESAGSWPVVELFVRYQAARDEIPVKWADRAVRELGGLEQMARDIVSGGDAGLVERVHLELVKRVLGYTVWWHAWDIKKGVQRQGGQS